MGNKRIDLGRSVHALCSEYPELLELMKDMGFKDIVMPGMLSTAGRIMTIPKGAAMKKIDLNVIIERLKSEGFDVIQDFST